MWGSAKNQHSKFQRNSTIRGRVISYTNLYTDLSGPSNYTKFGRSEDVYRRSENFFQMSNMLLRFETRASRRLNVVFNTPSKMGEGGRNISVNFFVRDL